MSLQHEATRPGTVGQPKLVIEGASLHARVWQFESIVRRCSYSSECTHVLRLYVCFVFAAPVIEPDRVFAVGLDENKSAYNSSMTTALVSRRRRRRLCFLRKNQDVITSTTHERNIQHKRVYSHYSHSSPLLCGTIYV